MQNVMTAPIRASRHLAIWLVWQSTGITLVAPAARNGVPRIHGVRRTDGGGRLQQAS